MFRKCPSGYDRRRLGVLRVVVTAPSIVCHVAPTLMSLIRRLLRSESLKLSPEIMTIYLSIVVNIGDTLLYGVLLFLSTTLPVIKLYMSVVQYIRI